MLRRFPKTAAIAAGAVAVVGIAAVGAVVATGSSGAPGPQIAALSSSHVTRTLGTPRTGRHVLLISVDGMHASDLARYIKENPESNLAKLTKRGLDYTSAQTTFPSDSFPGLASMLTGGTPKTVGLYYDNAYNRALYPVGDTTCTGVPGTNVTYDETISKNQFANLTDGGNWTSVTDSAHLPSAASQIDPMLLPYGKIGPGGACEPVYPHNDMFANTVFEVAHNAGLYTAWSDKNPGYDWVNGPDKYNNTAGSAPAVNDLFTPDIKGTIASSPATGVIGVSDLYVPLGPNAGKRVSQIDPGGQYTDSVDTAMANDSVKVQALINEIHGLTSTGGTTSPPNTVPAIFGMDYQAVSVGQKVTNGGYYDHGTTFSPNLKLAFDYVDASLGQIVTALQSQGLTDSTEIIISAKHGQSPTDRTLYHRIPEKASQTNHAAGSLTGFIAGASTAVPNGGAGTLAQETADDEALLWWQDASGTDANIAPVVAALKADPNQANDLSVKKVYAGADITKMFGTPSGPSTFNVTSAVPDVVIQPQCGVMYSTSTAKIADHGGGCPDDRDVALLVVQGAGFRSGTTVRTPVSTTQIAPTILSWLGLNPRNLTAVVAEGTRSLPTAGRNR